MKLICRIDASFVGTVDKDQDTLRVEQQDVFVNANAKVIEKKVNVLLLPFDLCSHFAGA